MQQTGYKYWTEAHEETNSLRTVKYGGLLLCRVAALLPLAPNISKEWWNRKITQALGVKGFSVFRQDNSTQSTYAASQKNGANEKSGLF